MRICIPTEDDRGLESRLHGHFGSAPFFSLADTESGEVEVVPNRGRHHHEGRGKPVDHIDVDRTDAVVCQVMGKRACASLTKGGVEVLITTARTVRAALAEARAGTLRRLAVKEACGGGHGREHGPER